MLLRLLRYRRLAAGLVALLLVLSPFAAKGAVADDACVETATVVTDHVADACCDDDAPVSDTLPNDDCGDCGASCDHSCACCATAAIPAPTALPAYALGAARPLGSLSPVLHSLGTPLPFDRPPR